MHERVSCIAIDPGPEQSAAIIYDGGTVGATMILDNETMIERVRMEQRATDEYRYPVVIEMIESFGMPVGESTFETVYWIGRFSEACGGAERISRMNIKMHLCGSSRAKDSNIRQALIDRFPATGGGAVPQVGTKADPGPLYGIRKDLWSALAVAVVWSDRISNTA